MSTASNETEPGTAAESAAGSMNAPMAPAAASAEIIPFPARAQEASAATAERLNRALAALDRALSDQRAAVSTWRGALGDLREAMAGLGGRVETYRGELGKLANGVAGLNARAVWLGDWAERTMAEARKG